MENNFHIKPVGIIKSEIKTRSQAPKQGHEGAPHAWIEIDKNYFTAMKSIEPGQELIIITWMHKADRKILEVHPRGNKNNPIKGVFSTRSPDRPNPLGLHHVTVKEIKDNKIKVTPLECIDNTPVADIKPVIIPYAKK